MNQELLEYKENGYLIKESIPSSSLLELKETFVNMTKNSYSKYIGKPHGSLEEDYVINEMFIELENKNHEYVTKIYDSIRLTSSFLNVVNSPNHISCCKKLLQVNQSVDLFINSMGVRMDPPGVNEFMYGWHTDADVNVGNSEFVQAWIPLVDIYEDLGGLEIIENSHIKEVKTEHTDAVRKSVKEDNQARATNSGLSYNTNPLVTRPPHNTKILTLDTNKIHLTPNFGQTLFFSNKLMHRSGLNLTQNKLRLALTAFYHRSDLNNTDWY